LNDDDVLEKYYDDFNTAMRAAEADFKENAPGLIPMLDAAAKATVLHRLILRRVREAFSAHEEVRISRYRNLEVMYIPAPGDARVIFKKLTPNLRSRSYRTPQNKAFLLQQTLKGFPPAAANYIVGYTLNALGTHIENTWATKPNGEGVEWFRCLDDNAGQEPLAVITPATPPKGPMPTVRVRADKIIRFPEPKADSDA